MQPVLLLYTFFKIKNKVNKNSEAKNCLKTKNKF